MKILAITKSAPLTVVPMGNRLYRLPGPFMARVITDEGAFVFKFVGGFVTNFRSGGVLVDAFIDQIGDERKALCYLIHDAIYTPCAALNLEHPLSRAKGDLLLRETLKFSGMGSFKANVVYRSVRMFGESAYREDDALTATNSKLFDFEWMDE